MIKANVHQAKTHLSKYLNQAEAGETVIICRHNVPVAELRPVASGKAMLQRKIGLGKGTAVILDSFFEPLPDDIVDSFRNPL